MPEPKVVHSEDVDIHPFHGAGVIKRLVYPHNVGSIGIFVGLADVPPGQAPHVFHRHGTEIVGDVQLQYAPEFEEFYFVVEGEGVMQWKPDSGGLTEVKVKAGDAIYMPRDTVQHRIFNSGRSNMKILYGGTPPALVTKTSKT